MLDSGIYRNAATRHMHDVIGNDGTVPAVFRAKAREQISKYPTVSMANATVTNIASVNNGSYFVSTDSTGKNYTSRKVILGTGLKDIIPNTPGLQENWGKGIYWCPWCDGYEHRDQPLGIIGPMAYGSLHSALTIQTLNRDVIVFVNGTWTDDKVAILNQRDPNWQQESKAYGFSIDNRTIASVTKIQNSDAVDTAGADLEHDIFLLNFTDGTSIQRDAFLTNFPAEQASNLGLQLGVEVKDQKMTVNATNGMRTNVYGVYAIGDANNDESTNVPHAMWSGKRSAVAVHGELTSEDAKALVSRDLEQDDEDEVLRLMGRDLEELWQDVDRQ